MNATRSGIYRGQVVHRRYRPVAHDFRYRLFMLYLDLDELDGLFDGRWLWSVGKRNVASFHRGDYLGDAEQPLREAVLDVVEAEVGHRPAGAVRMLTHLRYFGYCFNPVTFYYCFDRDDGVDAVVAEITNTPWGERHRYVLGRGEIAMSTFKKRFHVSPFMPMEQDYTWAFSAPSDDLIVRMTNHQSNRRQFDAVLHLERREITGAELAKALLRHPFMTGKVWLGIHSQALRLWWKNCPFHAHPRHRVSEAS